MKRWVVFSSMKFWDLNHYSTHLYIHIAYIYPKIACSIPFYKLRFYSVPAIVLITTLQNIKIIAYFYGDSYFSKYSHFHYTILS